MKNILLVILIVGLGIVGMSRLEGPPRLRQSGLEAPVPAQTAPAIALQPTQVAAPAPRFSCDGRTTCGQMTSCAEAEYFLAHCPNVQMDGNNDGEPCEQQWCN